MATNGHGVQFLHISHIWNLGTPKFIYEFIKHTNSYMKKSYEFVVSMNSYTYEFIYEFIYKYEFIYIHEFNTYEFIYEFIYI